MMPSTNSNTATNNNNNYVAQDLLWSRRDVKRFAAVYNRRIQDNPTQTRLIKSKFFNYILENFDKLQKGGTVRVVPNDAFTWINDKNDAIFSHNFTPTLAQRA